MFFAVMLTSFVIFANFGVFASCVPDCIRSHIGQSDCNNEMDIYILYITLTEY